MAEKWVIHNFITGKDVKIPPTDPNEPSQAWVDGWNACMEWMGDISDKPINPYEQHTLEHHDWQDAWESAERN